MMLSISNLNKIERKSFKLTAAVYERRIIQIRTLYTINKDDKKFMDSHVYL